MCAVSQARHLRCVVIRAQIASAASRTLEPASGMNIKASVRRPGPSRWPKASKKSLLQKFSRYWTANWRRIVATKSAVSSQALRPAGPRQNPEALRQNRDANFLAESASRFAGDGLTVARRTVGCTMLFFTLRSPLGRTSTFQQMRRENNTRTERDGKPAECRRRRLNRLGVSSAFDKLRSRHKRDRSASPLSQSPP